MCLGAPIGTEILLELCNRVIKGARKMSEEKKEKARLLM